MGLAGAKGRRLALCQRPPSDNGERRRGSARGDRRRSKGREKGRDYGQRGERRRGTVVGRERHWLEGRAKGRDDVVEARIAQQRRAHMHDTLA